MGAGQCSGQITAARTSEGPGGADGRTVECPLLPETWACIVGYLDPETAFQTSFVSATLHALVKEHGPHVLPIRDAHTRLVADGRKTHEVQGAFTWDAEAWAMRLEMAPFGFGYGQQETEHAWVNARYDLPPQRVRAARSVTGRLMCDALRPNGLYLNVVLLCERGLGAGVSEGQLEIKFDRNHLRSYNGSCRGSPRVTTEDFGLPCPTVQAGRWFVLRATFDWQGQQVAFDVDGQRIKTVSLDGDGWCGIAAVILRGYSNRWQHRVGTSYYRAVYVCP